MFIDLHAVSMYLRSYILQGEYTVHVNPYTGRIENGLKIKGGACTKASFRIQVPLTSYFCEEAESTNENTVSQV